MQKRLQLPLERQYENVDSFLRDPRTATQLMFSLRKQFLQCFAQIFATLIAGGARGRCCITTQFPSFQASAVSFCDAGVRLTLMTSGTLAL
jgi:hypothetical protein